MNNAAIPQNNGAVLNITQIIKNVMSSAAEAELGALYIIAREAVYMRAILKEMGHKQPPTPIQTDNSTAEGVVNSKIQPKRTKAMDMRFYWLRDRETREQFRFFWRAGKLNLADYWTKHHPALHHKNMRNKFLTQKKILDELRQRLESTREKRFGISCSNEKIENVLSWVKIRERRAWSFREGVLIPPGLALTHVPVDLRAESPTRTGLTRYAPHRLSS